MLSKKAPFLEQFREDINNDASSPYRPETAFCSRITFEQGGFEACSDEFNSGK